MASDLMSMIPDDLHPQDQQTLAMGAQALMSGEVTPDQVTKARKQLSSDPSWLDDHLTKMNQSNPYQLKGIEDLVNSGSKPGKGKQTKAETKMTTGSKDTTNKTTNYSGDEYQRLLDTVSMNPAIKSQQDGLDKQEQMLNMQMAQKGDNSDDWIRPLTALSDQVNHGNMMSSYKGVPTQADRNKTLASQMDELQKRKSDLSKTILEGVKGLKSGNEQNQQHQELMTALANNTGMNSTGQLGEVRRQRMVSDSGAAFDKDPILKTAVNTTESLTRAQSMLEGKIPLTPQGFAIAAQDFINSVAQGGAATEGKVNREMPHTLALKMAELQNYFVGNHDIRKDPAAMALVNQMLGQMRVVREDYRNMAMERAGDIAANYQNIDDPDIKATVARKVGRWTNKPSLQTQAPAGGGIKTSTKYPTGEPNSKWTDAQVQAFMDDHKG